MLILLMKFILIGYIIQIKLELVEVNFLLDKLLVYNIYMQMQLWRAGGRAGGRVDGLAGV